MTDIGKNTRREQIKKWRDGIQKNTELLLAFPVEQIEDDDIAVFRADVARRIEDLSVYLATGEWSLFLDTPLTFPEAQSEAKPEAAATVEAQGEVVDAEVIKPDELPLLPAPEATDDTKGKKGGKKRKGKKGGKE